MNKEERLMEYLYGEMDETARRNFERQLAADAGLRAELEALRHTRRLLASVSDVEPPGRLVAPPPRRSAWPTWGRRAAAAVVALGLLSLLNPRLEVGDGRLVFTLGATPPAPESTLAPALQTPLELEKHLAALDSAWQARQLAREEALRREWQQQLASSTGRIRTETKRYVDQHWNEQLPGLAGLFQDLQLRQQKELQLLLTDFWDHYQQTRAADLQSIESELANLYQGR